MSILLKNCFLMTLNPPFAGRCDIRIDGGVITGRGKTLPPAEGEETVDIAGDVVIPGMVCAHTHLYSSLARGMGSPARRPVTFRQILGRIWWKLDRALDEESVYYSAIAGAIESLRSGTTLIVDHHASPNAISGSLDLIRGALADVGLRGVLCYEVTDRGGRKERDAGLEENRRFIDSTKDNAQFRGLVGAHASFTLGKSSLEACGDLASAFGTGVHMHVAEDFCDVRDARRRSGKGLIRRLDDAGIVTGKSLFAHCVHLLPGEFRTLAKRGTWLVHNPRSNMNNGVGHAPVEHFAGRSALGTDGFPADMFDEARAAYFRAREGTRLRHADIGGILSGGWDLAASYFDLPFGSLETGGAADLAVLSYQGPTPVSASNVEGHFLFGLASRHVESVMVAGKWVLWNRALPLIDEAAVMERARKTAARLWKKLD